jgi:palmitoyltransferase ZDHHC9/14/18
MIVTSALNIFFVTKQESISFRHALGESVGSAVVFCLCIAVIWPIAALLMYHLRVCPFFALVLGLEGV